MQVKLSARWGVVAAAGLLAACSAEQPQPPAETTSDTETTTIDAVTPSITREVEPAQRVHLDRAPAEELCQLVSTDDLAQLAFPVEPGRPRKLGAGSPVRGCQFPEQDGTRSVLLAAQPPEYTDLGRAEVDLGDVTGTQLLRAGDCTVYAPVDGAALQVSVIAAEADSTQCETAQGIAQYVLAAVAR
ncbi:DUF3558 family protein [Saccharopolyspora rectivirgula]|uniref:DUF3558 family protein n=1 Tax=Saccharopolyspora rectivirgula TaxID=28042 RepID=UPI000411AA52|nr:DUF3558 family protein [Saccharopolyspora rectivirgula]